MASNGGHLVSLSSSVVVSLFPLSLWYSLDTNRRTMKRRRIPQVAEKYDAIAIAPYRSSDHGERCYALRTAGAFAWGTNRLGIQRCLQPPSPLSTTIYLSICRLRKGYEQFIGSEAFGQSNNQPSSPVGDNRSGMPSRFTSSHNKMARLLRSANSYRLYQATME